MVYYWIGTLKIIDKEELSRILESSDREIMNNIAEIVKSFSNIPENCTSKPML